MRNVAASEFKAHCLALLDEVHETGEILTILKRGRPVAQVIPALQPAGKYPQDDLVGSVEILGDIVSPAIPSKEWEVRRIRKK